MHYPKKTWGSTRVPTIYNNNYRDRNPNSVALINPNVFQNLREKQIIFGQTIVKYLLNILYNATVGTQNRIIIIFLLTHKKNFKIRFIYNNWIKKR